MAKRKASLWSYTAGQRPNTVNVGYTKPTGPIMVALWDPATKRRHTQSLGHRDQDRAMRYADAEAQKLRDGVSALSGAVTLGAILRDYLAHRTPKKQSERHRKEDARRAAMWLAWLGPDRRVRTLGRAEWERFIEARSKGIIGPDGVTNRAIEVGAGQRDTSLKTVKLKTVRLAGPRAVDADLVFLQAVFNWACTWNIGDRKLLDRNPWGVPTPGVKNPLTRPVNRAPRRPMMTPDRFWSMMKVAPSVRMACNKGAPDAVLVTMASGVNPKTGTVIPVKWWMRESYLADLLLIAAQTGRRISAICQLRYADLILGPDGIAALRWRPFKKEDESVVPVSAETRAVLEGILRKRPGLGERWLFPQGRNANEPITKRTASDWWEEAERLADIGHIDGGGWHMLRRAWATLRKGMPLQDVKAAGGWKDTRSLERCYVLTDAETTMRVVNAPTVDMLALRRKA